MNGRLPRYCPHVPHVTGHAPDPSGYAHSPITFPRLQPLIEIPKALARSAANASSSTQPVFLCRLHIMLGWFRAAFETIWDVDMD